MQQRIKMEPIPATVAENPSIFRSLFSDSPALAAASVSVMTGALTELIIMLVTPHGIKLWCVKKNHHFLNWNSIHSKTSTWILRTCIPSVTVFYGFHRSLAPDPENFRASEQPQNLIILILKIGNFPILFALIFLLLSFNLYLKGFNLYQNQKRSWFDQPKTRRK